MVSIVHYLLHLSRLFFLVFLLVFSSCRTAPDLKEQILNMPAKQYTHYSFDSRSDLISRVKDPPAVLLDYLRNMDNREDYSAYTPDEKELAMLNEYLQLLPPKNLEVMQEKLAGIYFVENLIGSALADYVLDDEGCLYNILIINPETMHHSMTDWLSYRENSCYRDSRDRIQISCGSKYTGLLYTLLHESAHIVDYNMHITPYTEYTSMIGTGYSPDKNNVFILDIWKDYRTPVKEYYKESFMENISFYGLGEGAEIDFEGAQEVYDQLLTTPFISLYGTMSWAEDFAELATWHHYTEVLGETYQVILKRDSMNIREWGFLENPLVEERLASLDVLYQKNQ